MCFRHAQIVDTVVSLDFELGVLEQELKRATELTKGLIMAGASPKAIRVAAKRQLFLRDVVSRKRQKARLYEDVAPPSTPDSSSIPSSETLLGW